MASSTYNNTGMTGGSAVRSQVVGTNHGKMELNVYNGPSELEIDADPEFDEWGKGMVRTAAFEEILQMLQKGQTWITVKGSPGEGKTTAVKMALAEFKKITGRPVFQARSPEDIGNIKKAYSEPVVMLDDVLGEREFHLSAWMKWKDVFHQYLDLPEHLSSDINTAKAQKHSLTIVMISRDYILHGSADHMGRLFDYITQPQRVIDMSHPTGRSIGEKRKILEAVVLPYIPLTMMKIRDVLDIDGGHGFPHVCRLYVAMKRDNPSLPTVKFFGKPLKFLNETIGVFLKDKNKLQLFKKLIKSEGEISEDELETLGLKQTAFDLRGTYLKVKKGIYRFDHPSIFDSVSFSMTGLHTTFVLETCPMPFIHERIRLESMSRNMKQIRKHNNLLMYISDPYIKHLAKRFAKELEGGNVRMVLTHPACARMDLVTMMMSHLSVSSLFEMTDRQLMLETSVPLKESHYHFDLYKLEETSSHVKIRSGFLALLASSKSRKIFHYIVSNLELSKKDMERVLFGICRYNASKLFTYLVKSELELDMNVQYGLMQQTPLMLAVIYGDSDFVSQIHSQGCDVYSRDKSGMTALHYMCKYSHVDIVGKLLNAGVDVNITSPMFGSPLSIACNITSPMFGSPLSIACSANQMDIIKLLLDKGARIGDEDVDAALRSDDPETVEEILRTASDRGQPIDEIRCFFKSCAFRTFTLIRYFVKKGISVNTTRDDQTPLHIYCINSHLRGHFDSNAIFVKCLIGLGADVTIKDVNGKTPLHVWYAYAYLLLGQAGIDVNAKDNDGRTPLHNAAAAGQLHHIEDLIKAGADVNVKDKNGRTPIHGAAATDVNEDMLIEEKHISTLDRIQTLINAGADVNVKDNDGRTPLHVAAKACSEYTYQLQTLLKAGADVNARSNTGSTPLHDVMCDVADGSLRDVKILLEHGADVNAVDSKENTPLHILCQFDRGDNDSANNGVKDNDCVMKDDDVNDNDCVMKDDDVNDNDCVMKDDDVNDNDCVMKDDDVNDNDSHVDDDNDCYSGMRAKIAVTLIDENSADPMKRNKAGQAALSGNIKERVEAYYKWREEQNS